MQDPDQLVEMQQKKTSQPKDNISTSPLCKRSVKQTNTKENSPLLPGTAQERQAFANGQQLGSHTEHKSPTKEK